MAKKKRKRSTKLSAPRTTKSVKRIRRRKRRKGMLSEFFTPGTAASAAKSTASGAAGGASTILIDTVFPAQTPVTRGLIKIGAGFVTAAMLGMPNMGAGMAGAGTFQAMQSAFGLSEGEGEWADDLEALPMFMSEDNMQLSEGEAAYMLSEGDAYQLSEQPGYYPDYAPTYH